MFNPGSRYAGKTLGLGQNPTLKVFYKDYNNLVAKPPNLLIYANDNVELFEAFNKKLETIIVPDKYVRYQLKNQDVLMSPWQENNEALILLKEPQNETVYQKILQHLNRCHGAKFLKIGKFEEFNALAPVVNHEDILKDPVFNPRKKISFCVNPEEVEEESLRQIMFKFLDLSVMKPKQGDEDETRWAPTMGTLFYKDEVIKSNFWDQIKQIKISPEIRMTKEEAQVSTPQTFDSKIFFSHLSTTKIGSVIVHSQILDSTFDVFETGDNLDGLVAICDRQLSGKGRGGNKWISPEGCAMFSVQIRLNRFSKTGRYASLLCHMTSLAVVKTLRAISEDVYIKWPNDIYFKTNLKIGGILVLTSFMGDIIVTNIGVGLNLSNDLPSPGLNKILGKNLSREEYIAKTLTNLENIIDTFNHHQLDFAKEYQKFWIHQDQKIKIKREADTETLEDGVVTGIDEFGFLKVKLQDALAQLISVQPDGNSFDMMKGLIYPKPRH